MVQESLLKGNKLAREKKANDFIVMANKIHGGYDYSKTKYVDARTKVAIICPEHGEFLQLPRKHLKGQQCPKCAASNANNYRKLTRGQFLKRAHEAHGFAYNYDKVNYVRIIDKVTITCPIHGDFNQVALSHLKGHGCSKCSRGGYKTDGSPIVYDTKWFVDLATSVHRGMYDYSIAKYTASHEDITIICPKHGKFSQIARDHLRGYGCPVCGLSRLAKLNARTTAEFIELAKVKHGDTYDYNKVDYVNKESSVVITCSVHGDFVQGPNHHVLRGQGCPICHVSSQQLEIQNFLSSLDIAFSVNDRIVISPYEIDILIQSKNIGIEYNGLYWHSYGKQETPEERNRHAHKADLAGSNNIKLLQVFENEWLDKSDIVKSIIKQKLGLNTRVYARDLELRRVDNHESYKFYTANHLQGHRGGINYALCDDGGPIAMMSFGVHHKYQFELLRFAARLNCAVVGGASRLLAAFVREHQPRSLLSFADRRYSDGNLYKALGFTLDGITNPGYFYVKGSKLYNRRCFQKHKLASKLPSFDSNATESTNMFNNGFRRLWDAGHYRFVKYWSWDD